MTLKFIYGSILSILLLTACGKEQGEAPQGQGGPQSFPAEAVNEQKVTSYTTYAASIEGEQTVEIRPKIDGFIEDIYVDEGQQVKKGQLLFKINTDQLSQQVSAASAAITAAEANVEAMKLEVAKLKPLVEKEIVSEKQLATAQSNLAAAKASLNQSRANYNNTKENMDYGYIKSPVAGVLGSIPYKVGALVGRNESQPLTTVADISNVRAYFSLNEKQLLALTKQLDTEKHETLLEAMPEVSLILVDGSEYAQKGKISAVNGLINTRTGSTEIRATFPNPNQLLRSGSSAQIKLPVVHSEAIRVPQSATFEVQNKRLVYVVGEDNKVKARPIEIATTIDNDFIVKSGLKQGERIVTAGAGKLKDGMEIVPQLADAGSAKSMVSGASK